MQYARRLRRGLDEAGFGDRGSCRHTLDCTAVDFMRWKMGCGLLRDGLSELRDLRAIQSISGKRGGGLLALSIDCKLLIMVCLSGGHLRVKVHFYAL